MTKIKITPQQFLTVSALLIGLEGLLCLVYLLSLPSDPKNAVWLGYSANRLLLAAIILAGVVGALALAWVNWRSGDLVEKLESAAKADQRRMNYMSLVLGGALVLAALALSVRVYIPEIYSISYQRVLPLLLFVTLALLHSAVLVFSQLEEKIRRRYLWGMMLVFLTGFYVGSAVYHAFEINTDGRRSDQVSWVEFSSSVKNSGFRDTGGRNFMPGYAYLQAIFVDLEQTVEQQFLSGKLINIGLSLLILGGTGLIIRRHLPPLPSFVLLAVIAFNLFVFKAAYYQPELLFYFVYFLIFYLSLLMLRESNWKVAVLMGLMLAVGHYVKASVLPGLLAFAVAFGLKQAVYWWRERDSRQLLSSLLNLVLTVIIFLTVLSPYLLESKAKYGHYFYNVNTTFYVWNDNWTQALNTTRLHGDQLGWPDMPPEEIPSFQKYVREHAWEDVITRELSGLGDVALSLLRPYRMIPYQILYVILALVLMVVYREMWVDILRRYWAIFLFATFLFPGYYALFAWYAPISGSTARFVSGLFMPFMFAIFLLLERLGEEETHFRINLAHWVVLALVFIEVFFFIPQRLMELVF
ncbi:MAG: hypothetical protein DWQ07_04495 [Chloroflexi bacterium]|nr:MAG: hypothetical protein DWQ07_04495 [Chloroflexota bacterium]MBL1194690.1 hypothetical protein [Chloroflexota bacterium]NOH11982.1 hypothetical protein [Chloroflexota bacterium]